MKRFTLPAKIALFTFILGLVSVFIWFTFVKSVQVLPDTDASEVKLKDVELEIPELSFCQLALKPKDYEGKVIRLNGVFMFSLHGPLIGDPNCSNLETQTWVKLSDKMWEEIRRAEERVYGKNTSGPINLTAIGKFENNNPDDSTDAWADRVPFRFELMEIVTAERPR